MNNWPDSTMFFLFFSGLCDAGNNAKVAAHAAAALRILAHANNAVKGKIVGHGGLEHLFSLCCPQNGRQGGEGTVLS